MKANKLHYSIVGSFPDRWDVVNTLDLLLESSDSMKIGPFGSRLKKELLTTSGFKVYGQENVSYNNYQYGTRYVDKEKFNELKSCEIRPGDVLITMMGSIGNVGIVPSNIEKGIMDSHLLRLRVDEKICDKEYLIYALRSGYVQKQISNLSVGIIMAGLSSSIVKKLTFLKPPLNEQKKIAKVLSDLDSKIELNNKINAELEAMAKLIYDYWFVQFDFPDKNGKPYKSSGGKMVYNEELKREIPESWEVGGFDDLGTIIGGTTPSKSDSSNFTEYGDGTPWITPKDLSNNIGKKYITRGEFDVTEKGIKSGSLKVMPAGTILLTSRAPIGYIAIARIGTTTNQGFKSIVPNSDFSSEYLYYTVQLYVAAMKQYASGSTFQEISGSVLKTIRIPIPPNSLVKLFTLKVENNFKEQDNLEIQNEKLAELRDWLLPMLMNGQVTVN